jgi:TetR/AcrR family transcriptional regulator
MVASGLMSEKQVFVSNDLKNRPKAQSRIQTANRQAILDGALAVFSTHGFRGATLDQIAAKAGMSKPNLLYYFANKDALYLAVLEETLEVWLKPLADLDPDGDPIGEISTYIDAKVAMALDKPEASRLFATEVIRGAPLIGDFLRGALKSLVDDKAAILARWIDEGRIAACDPHHLIMMIWAVTQHYADFDVQVRAVLGDRGDTGVEPDAATYRAEISDQILNVFLNGLRVGK